MTRSSKKLWVRSLSDFRVIEFLSTTIHNGIAKVINITTEKGVVYANN